MPTDYRPTQVNPEIGTQENISGFGTTISETGIHNEINGGTSIKPSVVQTSVLPTIDGGTKVLGIIYGGTKSSIAQENNMIGENMNIMGVDERLGDNAADVTYSTKPDQ